MIIGKEKILFEVDIRTGKASAKKLSFPVFTVWFFCMPVTLPFYWQICISRIHVFVHSDIDLDTRRHLVAELFLRHDVLLSHFCHLSISRDISWSRPPHHFLNYETTFFYRSDGILDFRVALTLKQYAFLLFSLLSQQVLRVITVVTSQSYWHSICWARAPT